MSSNNLIQITNVEKADGKNGAVAHFDAIEVPRKFKHGGMTYFEKGANTFVTASSQRYSKDGETRYKEICGFIEAPTQRRFLDQVKRAFQDYLKDNPNLDPEPVIKADDDIPF